ncbi:MAG: energy transducer TonB [Gemmatimonadaceae bacterium]
MLMRHVRTVIVTLFGVLVAAGSLRAQDRSDASACDSIRTDVLLGTAIASISGIGADTTAPRVLLQTALAALSDDVPEPHGVAQVDVNAGLVVTSLRGAQSLPRHGTSTKLTPGPHLILRSAVDFVLHKSGGITGAQVVFADAGAYADSLRDWLSRDTDGRLFVPFPADFPRDSVRLRFTISLRADSGAIQQPLFRVAEPRTVTRSARLAPRALPPGYPSRAEGKGEWADILAEFVVRPNGSVDDNSLHITPLALGSPADSQSTRAFVDATRGAVKHWRFSPATRAGCHVAQRILVPIYFQARMN